MGNSGNETGDVDTVVLIPSCPEEPALIKLSSLVVVFYYEIPYLINCQSHMLPKPSFCDMDNALREVFANYWVEIGITAAVGVATYWFWRRSVPSGTEPVDSIRSSCELTTVAHLIPP